MALRPPRLRPAVAVPARRDQRCCWCWPPRRCSWRPASPTPATTRPATTHRRAYDLLAEGFGPGFNAPLLVVADLRAAGLDADDVTALAEQHRRRPGHRGGRRPQSSPDGDTVVLPTLPTTAPADPATSATLARLRALAPDGVARGRPDRA